MGTNAVKTIKKPSRQQTCKHQLPLHLGIKAKLS